MGDDPVSPPAPDTNQTQPADDQNRPEPQADVQVPASTTSDVPSPASESASSQPEQTSPQDQSQATVTSEPASVQSSETPEAPSASQPPQVPETPSVEPVPMSTSDQTEPSGTSPSAQVVPPQSEPVKEENPPIQVSTEPQGQTGAEAIPQLHYPYYSTYPITFDFGAVSSDENIKQKYQQWGIVGHNGIDFGLPEGTDVLSCDEGIVFQVGDNGDFGISVTIKHIWGTSIYCHLQSFGVLVSDHVSKAQVIGLSDHTGFATGPHLHFGIQPNDPNVNNGYLGYINPNPYVSESSEKPTAQPQSELQPHVQPQPENPSVTPDIPISPISPQIPQEDIQKQATAMFDARQKENSVKGNQAKKEKRDEALQKIFTFAQEKKKITNEQIRDLLHISQSSATNYLSTLVQRGILKVEGKGKATVYLY